MESQETKAYHADAKLNDLKFKLIRILFFTIPHTICWRLFDIYSDKLYVLMMAILFVVAAVYSLDYLGFKGRNYPKVLFLGTFPVLIAWIFPKYTMFAICGSFICFWSSAISVSPREISYLVASNTVGWVAFYLYPQDGYDETDIKYFNIFFDDRMNFYQLVLGLIMCFAMARLVAIEMQSHITAQINYEQKLLSLNKEFEDANQKLFQTNKELQDALQEKENFILRFSHEIRNPLNSLLGNVDLCEEFAENEEPRQMLREAKVSGEILLQLLNNVLDTAKVSAGRLDISLHYQNTREFMERAWIVCSEIIRKKKLYGCLSLDAKVPEKLEFDTHRLMQILINTVSNASKFTEYGHVKVFVEYEEGIELNAEDMKLRHADSFEKPDEGGLTLVEEVNQEEFNEKPERNYEILSPYKKKFAKSREGSLKKLSLRSSNSRTGQHDGYLRLEIIDTGCGIKKKDLEAIFAKFSQVNEESSKRQIGTGLGLWITKEIVELMNGKIEVFSVPNHGTVLVLMLKCRSGEPTQPEIQSQIIVDSEPNSIKRAMVVEDILYNQEINCKFLQKCGVEEIAVTSNGKEALDLYIRKGEGYFDLILMDIDMPVMDGKAATLSIRQHEAENQWEPTSIVFLTAYSEAKLQKELLDPQGVYKANGFLSKPTSQEIIKWTLNEQSSKSPRKKQKSIVCTNLNQKGSSDGSCSPNQLVLVIDDDPYNLSIVSKMLTKCGFKPLEALNGREALKLYDKHWKDISLVLTDCEMPVMDGIRVTQEIFAKQKNACRGQLPIYGITGHVEHKYKMKCLDTGMKDVLAKPITFERLKALLLGVK